MVEEAAQKVAEALEALGFVEVVEMSFRSDQIGLLCRIPTEGDALKIIYQLLAQEEGWQSHMCKKYFSQDTKVRYGWNFAFRSDDIQTSSKRIVRVLKLYKKQYLDTPDAGGPIEEGSSVRTDWGTNRNNPSRNKGKGATRMGG